MSTDLLGYFLELYKADPANAPQGSTPTEQEDDRFRKAVDGALIQAFVDFCYKQLRENAPVGVTYATLGLALQFQDSSVLSLLPDTPIVTDAIERAGSVPVTTNRGTRPTVLNYGDVPVTGTRKP